MNYEALYKALLAKRKAYRSAHKAEISVYYKEWYEKNKEALSQRRREKRLAAKQSQ